MQAHVSACILEHSGTFCKHSGTFCMHSGTFWVHVYLGGNPKFKKETACAMCSSISAYLKASPVCFLHVACSVFDSDNLQCETSFMCKRVQISLTSVSGYWSPMLRVCVFVGPCCMSLYFVSLHEAWWPIITPPVTPGTIFTISSPGNGNLNIVRLTEAGGEEKIKGVSIIIDLCSLCTIPMQQEPRA